jgi:metallophosphoesterase superfamily enzyme
MRRFKASAEGFDAFGAQRFELSDWTCSCMGNRLQCRVSGRASVTESAQFATLNVAPGIVLDSRLALWHENQRWLACSDLHFGYELKQRALGGLFPLWGMQDIEARLRALVAHYQPGKLILVGDIMDFAGSVDHTLELVARLSRECEIVCIAGNHDHPVLVRSSAFVRSHTEDGFFFHHGHRMKEMCQPQAPDAAIRTHITGHWHPAHVFRDGAGLSLKLPAFVQTSTRQVHTDAAHDAPCWVLPAFSPWASGSRVASPGNGIRVSAIHPSRIVTVE